MSYDLYFTKPQISEKQFSGYFGQRANYTLENRQAWYCNEDTGVYFCFDFYPEKQKDEDIPDYQISFNINFLRPHFFAFEADFELKAFVEHFNCEIFDPQDMITSPVYSSEDFLKGWNLVNQLACEKTKEETGEGFNYTRPSEELQAVWKWNYSRNSLQTALGQDIFVPVIVYAEIDGRLQSFVVWTDTIPALIPQVESLVVVRQTLAPRRFFFRRTDICMAPFDEFISFFKPYETNQYGMTAYQLSEYSDSMTAAAEYVKNMQANKKEMNGIPMDQILNQEICQEN